MKILIWSNFDFEAKASEKILIEKALKKKYKDSKNTWTDQDKIFYYCRNMPLTLHEKADGDPWLGLYISYLKPDLILIYENKTRDYDIVDICNSIGGFAAFGNVLSNVRIATFNLVKRIHNGAQLLELMFRTPRHHKKNLAIAGTKYATNIRKRESIIQANTEFLKFIEELEDPKPEQVLAENPNPKLILPASNLNSINNGNIAARMEEILLSDNKVLKKEIGVALRSTLPAERTAAAAQSEDQHGEFKMNDTVEKQLMFALTGDLESASLTSRRKTAIFLRTVIHHYISSIGIHEKVAELVLTCLEKLYEIKVTEKVSIDFPEYGTKDRVKKFKSLLLDVAGKSEYFTISKKPSSAGTLFERLTFKVTNVDGQEILLYDHQVPDSLTKYYSFSEWAEKIVGTYECVIYRHETPPLIEKSEPDITMEIFRGNTIKNYINNDGPDKISLDYSQENMTLLSAYSTEARHTSLSRLINYIASMSGSKATSQYHAIKSMYTSIADNQNAASAEDFHDDAGPANRTTAAAATANAPNPSPGRHGVSKTDPKKASPKKESVTGIKKTRPTKEPAATQNTVPRPKNASSSKKNKTQSPKPSATKTIVPGPNTCRGSPKCKCGRTQSSLDGRKKERIDREGRGNPHPRNGDDEVYYDGEYWLCTECHHPIGQHVS